MARLKKGQVAKGIAEISHKKKESVRVFLDFFEKFREKNASDLQLVDLKSYKSICVWIGGRDNGQSISANTLKKNIDELYSGGVKRFNKHREECFKQSNSCSKENRSSLQSRLSIAERRCSALVDEVLMLSERHLDLLEKLQQASVSNEFIKNSVASHLKAFSREQIELRIVRGRNEKR